MDGSFVGISLCVEAYVFDIFVMFLDFFGRSSMPLRQCQCAYPGAVLETTVLAELSMLECLSKLETQVSWNSFFFGDLSVIFPESQVANDTLEGGFNRPLEML